MVFSWSLKLLWGVVGLALAFVLFAILSLVDHAQSGDETARGATFGFLLMAGFFGIPGGIALVRARARAKHEKTLSQLTAYVRSRDAIALSKVAQAVGRTEIETETLILQLIEEEKVDLIFHQSREEYLHRGRIRDAHQCLEKCTSCGARLKAQVIFEGEQVSCEYCNAPLSLKPSS